MSWLASKSFAPCRSTPVDGDHNPRQPGEDRAPALRRFQQPTPRTHVGGVRLLVRGQAVRNEDFAVRRLPADARSETRSCF